MPPSLYNQIADRRKTIEKSLSHAAAQLEPGPDFDFWLGIRPEPLWRQNTRRWLYAGLSNQGRVRSDAVAPYEVDGLRFRSQPEIHLYRALKARDISFAPNSVWIRGGDNYRRVETDFVIYKDGQLVVLEVDGSQFHHETPVEAHERLTLFAYEGAHIERIRSAECDTAEKAETLVANSILPLLKKLKANR